MGVHTLRVLGADGSRCPPVRRTRSRELVVEDSVVSFRAVLERKVGERPSPEDVEAETLLESPWVGLSGGRHCVSSSVS